MKNTITIFHQDGDCEFPIETIDLRIDENLLFLKITGGENEDCNLGLLGEPMISAEMIDVSSGSLDDLVREELEIVDGTDLCRLYISNHFYLDHNKMLLETQDDGSISLIWDSDSDVDYYDSRAKRNRVSVKAVIPKT